MFAIKLAAAFGFDSRHSDKSYKRLWFVVQFIWLKPFLITLYTEKAMNPNDSYIKIFVKPEDEKVKKNRPTYEEEVKLLRMLIDSGAKMKRLQNETGEVTWIVSWGEISQ